MVFVQPLDLAMVLRASQNYALKEREDRLDAEAREARRHDLDLEQGRLDLAAKIKMAQSKVLGAQSEADKKTAMGELAATDPASAMSMEKHQLGIEEQQREAEAAQVAQAKSKRAEATQQQLKLAEITRDVLGKSVVKGSAGQEIVSFGELNRGMSQMRNLAQAGLIPQEPVAQLEQGMQQMLTQAQQAGPAGQALVQKQLVPQLRAMQEDADKVIGVFGDPEKMQRYDALLEKAAGMASADLQAPWVRQDPLKALGDPTAAPLIRKYMEQIEIEEPRARAKSAGQKGTTIVQMPGLKEPSRQFESVISDRLDMAEGFLAKANAIESQLKPEFFGIEGKARGAVNWTMGQFGALPERQAIWQEQKQEITTFGTMMLYDLIVAMSGKAVTDKEFQRIQKAVGDPDSMTFNEYSSAVKAMKKVMNFSKQRYQKMMQPGGGQNYITDDKDRIWLDEQVAGLEDAVSAEEITPEQAEKRKAAITQRLMLKIGGREARERLSGKPAAPAAAGGPAKSLSDMSDEELEAMAR